MSLHTVGVGQTYPARAMTRGHVKHPGRWRLCHVGKFGDIVKDLVGCITV